MNNRSHQIFSPAGDTGGTDDAVDALLADADTRLDAALTHTLDLDSHLSDIVGPDNPQDIQVGTAVLTPSREPAPASHSDDSSSPLLLLARTVAALPWADRLALRGELPLRELVLAQSVARWRAVTLLIIDLIHHNDQADLVRARDLALILAGDIARDNAREIAHDIARNSSRDVARDSAHGFAHAIAYAHVHVLNRARALASALAIGHDSALALVLARDIDAVLARAFARALARVNKLASNLAGALDHDRSLDQLQTSVAAVDLLTAAVTDFTEADLSQVDLRGLRLAGVRWSCTTRWPAGWEQRIERTSVSIGEGLYEIRDTPPTDIETDLASSR